MRNNEPFPRSPGPLYQNEVKCSAFDMKMVLNSHANKTHFYKKGCALGLMLKVRLFGIRKWPIIDLYINGNPMVHMIINFPVTASCELSKFNELQSIVLADWKRTQNFGD